MEVPGLFPLVMGHGLEGCVVSFWCRVGGVEDAEGRVFYGLR